MRVTRFVAPITAIRSMEERHGKAWIVANLRDRVQDRFAVLTRVQKDVIQAILMDYEEYIFLSVDEAARQVGVHKSTLVRLAQSLEYEGYTELRADLQDLYRQEITPGEKHWKDAGRGPD